MAVVQYRTVCPGNCHKMSKTEATLNKQHLIPALDDDKKDRFENSY